MFPKIPHTKKNIYLDNAAATPLDSRVFRAMKPYFFDIFANASSLYSLAVRSKISLENSRQRIARILSTQEDTILFTSGATESNNLALMGAAQNYAPKGKHIISTRIEHDSVLRPLDELKKQGYTITYLDVDANGCIDIEQFKKMLRKDTVLVSFMYANNEIGTLAPISDIGREILKWRKNKNTLFPLFHTDAAQAPNYLDLSVEKLHVDLMTLNSSKIYGPKGVGVLYKRRGVKLQPQIFGGKQEFSYRAGTENISGIVGFAKALEIAHQEKENNNREILKLTKYFWNALKKQISDVELNGPILDNEKRLPCNLNVYLKGVESEALVLYLDSYGISASSGSACSTDSNSPSHVLKACGYSDRRALQSIRFTLGVHTTKQDIDYTMKYLPKIVQELRKNI